MPVLTLPFLQGVRQKRTVFARRRRRRDESLLSRNTCGGSSKRWWKSKVWSSLAHGLNPAGAGLNHCIVRSPTASPRDPPRVRTPLVHKQCIFLQSAPCFICCHLRIVFVYALLYHLMSRVCACFSSLVHLCTFIAILSVYMCVMQVILWRCPCWSKRRAQQQAAGEVNLLTCSAWCDINHTQPINGLPTRKINQCFTVADSNFSMIHFVVLPIMQLLFESQGCKLFVFRVTLHYQWVTACHVKIQ